MQEALRSLVDAGVAGAGLVVALFAIWAAWKRLQLVTDSFIKHLDDQNLRMELMVEKDIQSRHAAAVALAVLEKSIEQHDRMATDRHLEIMRELRPR